MCFFHPLTLPAPTTWVFALLLGLGLLSYPARAQQADNENGTYTNPVIWADFPDNDAIRVGDTYYMVTTTMHYFPGVPVMASKDLVNWQYLSNAVPRFDQHPFYNMEGGTRYPHGQWASSLRYHNGQFYILFVTLDEGGFLCTAPSAQGPWKLTKLPKAYYDAGLFFDDDGRIYIVHGYSKLTLTEVNPDLSPKSADKVIFDKVQRRGLEGTHVYKINGYYYLYCTYGGRRLPGGPALEAHRGPLRGKSGAARRHEPDRQRRAPGRPAPDPDRGMVERHLPGPRRHRAGAHPATRNLGGRLAAGGRKRPRRGHA